MADIDKLAYASDLPPFVSVINLPLGKIYTITTKLVKHKAKLVKRVKGIDNALYTGVHLYLDDALRTNLPGIVLNSQKWFSI